MDITLKLKTKLNNDSKKNTNCKLNDLREKPNDLETENGSEQAGLIKMVRNEERATLNTSIVRINAVVEFLTLDFGKCHKSTK